MSTSGVTYRAKSPLRISFAGGGTDVSPYCDLYGGCALNATINKFAFTSLEVRPGGGIEVHSLDYDYLATFRADDPLANDGNSDLAKAVIRRMRRGNDEFSITTRNDAPPGSGLGSSSAMAVSLIGAFKEWQSLHLTDYQVAQLAYSIEREDLGWSGGKQDQYASAFGGFNFMEFAGDQVLVNPLRMKAETLNELEFNLLLYYTGTSRLSARIIDRQVQNVNQARKESLAAMHQLREQAVEMKKALLTGRTREFGALLDCAWQSKKKMAEGITNPVIDEMYEEAVAAGAIGGKVSGAGGGGFMVFYCDSNRRHKVAARLEQLGGEVVDFQFERAGLKSWRPSSDLALRSIPASGEPQTPAAAVIESEAYLRGEGQWAMRR